MINYEPRVTTTMAMTTIDYGTNLLKTFGHEDACHAIYTIQI